MIIFSLFSECDINITQVTVSVSSSPLIRDIQNTMDVSIHLHNSEGADLPPHEVTNINISVFLSYEPDGSPIQVWNFALV